jgi:hypothetical protein
MTTPRVGDQGVDIIAQKAGKTLAIQVKRYADKAPNSAVQAVHTGAVYYGCDQAILVCLGGFSRAAIEVARATHVELMDGAGYADMVHRIAPTAQRSSIWLPKGETLLITASMTVLGIAAILFGSVWVAQPHTAPSAVPASLHKISPLLVLALALIALSGILGAGKRRRRRRRSW